MPTISFSSPALLAGFRAKMALLLAGGYLQTDQQYFLSSDEQDKAQLSIPDLRFLAATRS